MAGDAIDGQHGLPTETAPRALIGDRRIRKTIRDDDLAFGQRRQDPLLDILRARREHQQQFGGWG